MKINNKKALNLLEIGNQSENDNFACLRLY